MRAADGQPGCSARLWRPEWEAVLAGSRNSRLLPHCPGVLREISAPLPAQEQDSKAR